MAKASLPRSSSAARRNDPAPAERPLHPVVLAVRQARLKPPPPGLKPLAAWMAEFEMAAEPARRVLREAVALGMMERTLWPMLDQAGRMLPTPHWRVIGAKAGRKPH